MAVGVNCVNPKDVTSLLTLMNTVNHWSAWPNVFNYEKVPYVVYPNAGSIDDWDHVSKRWAKDGNISDILENVKVMEMKMEMELAKKNITKTLCRTLFLNLKICILNVFFNSHSRAQKTCVQLSFYS